uniref:Ig-like domain-containing protein n=1 Tax=Sphenodon punctatus TaxID=8508 RepID=A0A8D0GN30_SPHPU
MGTLWLFVSAFFLAPRSVAGNSVTQTQGSVSQKEGQSVIINCGYSTTYTSYILNWYQQQPGKQPVLIAYYRSWASSDEKPISVLLRFSSKLNTAAKSYTLVITEAQLSDSTVYFCALREATVLQSAQI